MADDIDHCMGQPLRSVQQQHPTRSTGGICIETPLSACGVDTKTGCKPQHVELSCGSQCVFCISEPEDCRDSIRCISCGQLPGETDCQQCKTAANTPPPPERPERELNLNTKILGFRQLCRNASVGPSDNIEAWTPHQHMDNQHQAQNDDTTLPKLQSMVDCFPSYTECVQRLKDDWYGFHEVTEEIDISEDELKVFAEVMDMSSVRPIIVDSSGFVFWIVDGQGRMFLWSEMEACLQFMGNNIVEGFEKYFEGPENMPVWHNGAWVPKKELIRLGKERYKQVVAKGPIVIPGTFTRWGTLKKQKKQKRKHKQK